MFEIRLDDILITRADDWREAHIEVIDYLLDNDSPTLKNLYQHYALYTDEDLFYELASMTDKRITIVINFTLDVPVVIKKHILDGFESPIKVIENNWQRKYYSRTSDYLNLAIEYGEIINQYQDKIVSLKQENRRLKRENWNLKKTKGKRK